MIVKHITSADLIEAAEKALDGADWTRARELLDQLDQRGVRNAGLSTLAQTPQGESLRAKFPEYAKVLTDRIELVNRPLRGRAVR